MSKKITVDGNAAAAHVAYAFSDVAAIFPITPASPMAELADEWAAKDVVNLFGQKVRISEMQSELGAAGAVHGAASTGALANTFTSSQGLLLMIPNMYKIAGELEPCVFHVAARSLGMHGLSIYGDHADVMACRQTGFAMLASNSVQEAMDMALVAHLSTIRSKIPFMHFFDGFRTSHEIQKIEAIDYEDMRRLLDWEALADFRKRGLNPEHPHLQGQAQDPDIYFQNREACNKYYLATPKIVEEEMEKVGKITGRSYRLFDFVGAPDAENVIILIGSGAEAVEETVEYLNAQGAKLGVLKVRLYRPFSAQHFAAALPKTVKVVSVLDRTKEPGSVGEPLYADVCAALKDMDRNDIKVLGGRYALANKEFNPSGIKAVFDNAVSEQPKNHFTVGITDDVTFTSLEIKEHIDAAPEGTVNCKFYGLGSDGTVGANKNTIKIIGDHTDLYVQAYFAYDSKKSGGLTVSHLRFGKKPIKSTYKIDAADFVACHNPSYITRYDTVSDLKDGGIYLLNCSWSEGELEEKLPVALKQALAKKKARFYTIDAIKIANDVGMGKRINTIMQAAFFKLTQVIPYEQSERFMKDAVRKSYNKKGDEVIDMNIAAIDNAVAGITEIAVPVSWATTTVGAEIPTMDAPDYYFEYIQPILVQEGDKLPVSAFPADGKVPTGTTKYEKRGIAVDIPAWIPENCIQCNQCSLVCPHACIRPVLVKEGEKTPESFVTKPATGKEMAGYQYRMQVSPLDCTGCGSCAHICPAKNKALVMKPLEELRAVEEENWDYALSVPAPDVKLNKETVKDSQFLQPLFEFSGACAGCGETPYVKLLTQLYGDRMIIANATGCSTVFGSSAPTCPYTTNDRGHGPAWGNSLFEDNAEFGFGINLAVTQRREKLADLVSELAGKADEKGREICEKWLAAKDDAEGSKAASALLKEYAENCRSGNCGDLCREILSMSDMMVKKSIWLIGGDGWAYDIGYGGLDHVLAQNEDVNILVLDTEVYSNTGGQASKATPTGSAAKFTAAGKRTKKKDLGMMAMNYGYVYVATVAMGASPSQLLKAVTEAEAYKGTSIIIAYAPCINHGIDMSKTQSEEKKAVETGYWQLYRYNPLLKKEGRNPFIMDSKVPSVEYREFLEGEERYTSLLKLFPDAADKLFKQAAEDSKERIENYLRLARG